jgi:hypothetical protein
MVPEAVREGRAPTLNLPHAFATTLFVQSGGQGSNAASLRRRSRSYPPAISGEQTASAYRIFASSTAACSAVSGT